MTCTFCVGLISGENYSCIQKLRLQALYVYQINRRGRLMPKKFEGFEKSKERCLEPDDRSAFLDVKPRVATNNIRSSKKNGPIRGRSRDSERSVLFLFLRLISPLLSQECKSLHTLRLNHYADSLLQVALAESLFEF
jgi:hypothetical protein